MSIAETESNDSRDLANAAALGAPILGNLSSYSDIDYYQVTVNEAGVLSISLTTSPPTARGGSFRASVYDASGVMLGSWYALSNLTVSGSVGALAAGTYYVSIAGESQYFFDAGQYTLTATATAGGASGYEHEANDVREAANLLVAGSPIAGRISFNSDVDYYAVQVNAGELLTVTSNSGAAVMQVEDANGVVLAGYTNFSAGHHVSANIDQTGTYYVRISNTYVSDYNFVADVMAGGGVGYETEGNNTRATADVLALDSTRTGQLSSNSDVDYYAIEVLEGGVLSLTFDHATIRVEDGNGTILAVPSSGVGPQALVGIAEAGTYYLRVAGTNYNDPYAVSASFAAGGWEAFESESNDTLANADPMSLEVPITGRLSVTSDVDYYAVSVESGLSGGILNVSFDWSANSQLTSGGRNTIRVHDSSGAVLASYVDFADPQAFNVGIATSGTYYLSVRGSIIAFTSDRYILTATFADGAGGYEMESNDTRATAGAYALGAQVVGQLSSASDIDYFGVTVGTDGILSVTFSPSNTFGGLYTIGVEDSNGVVLASCSDNVDPKTLSLGVSDAGTYYVRIGSTFSWNSYHASPYSLTTSFATGGSAAYESEPNNTQGTADTLTLGSSIIGQAGINSDADYFAVPVSARGILGITLDGPESMQIVDEAGKQLGYFYSSSGSQVRYVDIAQAGTCYIRVGDANGASYTVTAASFTVDHAPTGSISILGSPYPGETLTVVNDLADCDGIGAMTYSWQRSSDGVTWTGFAGGSGAQLFSGYIGQQIQVVASYVDGLGYTERVSSSRLTVTTEPEVAGSIDTTGGLIIGGNVSSKIESTADRDYFKVHLVAGTAYQFDLQGGNYTYNSSPIGDPYLTLRSATGMALRADNDGASVYPIGGSGHSANSQIVFIAPESGTYFLDVSGNAGATGTYKLSAATLNPDYYVQSILDQPNLRWNADQAIGTAVNVTFSFPSSLPSEYPTDLLPGYTAFSAGQQAATRAALQEISSYSGITFTEVADQSGQIRFATSQQSGTAGFTAGDVEGEAFIRVEVVLANNVSSNADLAIGTRGWYVLLHEIEHALGLKHPGNYNGVNGGEDPPFLPASQDAVHFTIETYNDANTASTTTPMLFDVAALQFLYGDNATTGAGNSNYALDADMIYTVWDVSGDDALDASAWLTSVTLDLNPGTVSYAGYVGIDAILNPRVGIAFNSWIEDATGGSGNDAIIGNIGGNTLVGGAGNDWLDGAGGVDSLIGGPGNDTLHGGSGVDAAHFAGSRSDYTITKGDGYHYTITDNNPTDGDEGVDAIFGIEQMQFADTTELLRAWGTWHGFKHRPITPFWAGTDWQVMDSQHDFDGNGKNDLLMQKPDGSVALWLMDGAERIAGAIFGPIPGRTLIAAMTDYNGDGKTDLGWREGDGSNSYWLLGSGWVSSATAPPVIPPETPPETPPVIPPPPPPPDGWW